CGVVIQAAEDASVEKILSSNKIDFKKIGTVSENETLHIKNNSEELAFSISEMRDVWYKTSYLLDKNQSGEKLAKKRFDNYKNQPLKFEFPKDFTGSSPNPSKGGERPKAAVIREKGSNSEREMAYMMHLAGFDVKDVHMTDLIDRKSVV